MTLFLIYFLLQLIIKQIFFIFINVDILLFFFKNIIKIINLKFFLIYFSDVVVI